MILLAFASVLSVILIGCWLLVIVASTMQGDSREDADQ